MTINAYTLGKVVRVSAAFTTAAGAATDPTAVLCKYLNPAGTTVTLTYGIDAAVVKDAAGNYHVDIDANVEGAWYVRWYSTGVGQAAEESQFLVVTSAF